MKRRNAGRVIGCLWLSVVLGACKWGGGSNSTSSSSSSSSSSSAASSHTIGGTVSGLSGSGLVLQNNGADDLPRSADGAFTFATAIASGANYNVTVLTQPTSPAQTCTPTNNTGIVTGNVTNVTITCVTNSTVGSAVIGSAGGVVDGFYGAKITVPAGALANTVTIGLSRDSSNSPAFAVPDIDAIGATYELTPHGQSFSAPVTVRIPFDPAQLPNDEEPVLYKAETGGAFTALPTTVNGNFLEATVSNFSWVIPASQASKPRMVYAIQAAGAFTSSELGSFKINKTSGAVSAVTSSAAIGAVPTFVVAHPSRRFAYVGHGGNNTVNNIAPNSIAVYGLSTVNGKILGGAARSNAATSAALGYAPTSATVHPSGKFLYVLNGGALVNANGAPGSGVDVFTINGSTGALTLTNNSITGGMPPMGMVFNRLGTTAYVLYAGSISSNTFSTQVKMYTVNTTTGALTGPVSGIAAGVLGSAPVAIAIDPNEKFLYVATFSTDEVIAYGINSGTGALTNIGSITVTAGSKLASLAIDSFGRFLYAARGQPWLSRNLLPFQYNATTGALTAGTGVLTACGGGCVGSIAAVADPQGQFVYAVDPQQKLSGFTVNQTSGALTMVNSLTDITAIPFAVTGASPVWQNNCTQNCAMTGTVSSGGGGGSTTNPTPPTSYFLTVSEGAYYGGVTSSPGGINIEPPTNSNPLPANDFSASFPANSTVTLCSTPPPQPIGPYDRTWSGSCSGTGACTSVNMTSDKQCHLEFSPIIGR